MIGGTRGRAVGFDPHKLPALLALTQEPGFLLNPKYIAKLIGKLARKRSYNIDRSVLSWA
jgi:hypothetical protein